MVSLLADTANRLPVQVVMDTLLQAPAAILNNNLAATPLNSQEGTRPRAAATRQHLVSISECKLYCYAVSFWYMGTCIPGVQIMSCLRDRLRIALNKI